MFADYGAYGKTDFDPGRAVIKCMSGMRFLCVTGLSIPKFSDSETSLSQSTAISHIQGPQCAVVLPTNSTEAVENI